MSKDDHKHQHQPNPNPNGQKGKEQPTEITEVSREELEAQLTTAENKALQYQEQALRLQAEIENIRRRAEKDVSAAHKYGQEKLLNELLLVVDSLERALSNFAHPEIGNPELIQKLHSGMDMTLSILLKTLEKFGVTQVDPQGQPFNPAWHQALSMQENHEATANTVLQVLQKGYLMQDRLLRPALVVVAK